MQIELPATLFNDLYKVLDDSRNADFVLFDSLICIGELTFRIRAEDSPDPRWRPSKDGKAMVSSTKFMRPRPEHKGMRCILQGPGNVPIIAIYDGAPYWKGICPLPDLVKDD